MKRYYGGPIGNHQSSFDGTNPDPLRTPLPQDWGSQPQPKTAIAIISETGKATDLKFGWYSQRVNSIRTKTHSKFWKKGAWAYPIFDYPYYLRIHLRESRT